MGTIKARITPSFSEISKRAKIVPTIMQKVFMSGARADAVRLVKIFEDGIENNSFGLEPLDKATIESKQRQSFPRPKIPLYGRGPQEAKSYLRMLRIRALKNGYRVFPSHARHWKSKLQLNELFHVHEYGAIITVGKGDGAKMVRIPPRPAFLRAHQKWSREKLKNSKSPMIRSALAMYLKSGQENHLNKVQQKIDAGIQNYLNRLMSP